MSDIKAGDRVVSKFGAASVSGKVMYVGTELGPRYLSLKLDGLDLPIHYLIDQLQKDETAVGNTPTGFAGVVAMVILLLVCLVGFLICGFASIFNHWFLIPTLTFLLGWLLASYRLSQSKRR